MRWSFIILLAIQVAAYLGMVGIHLRYGTLTHAQVPLTIVCYLIAFGAYLLSIWLVERGQDPGPGWIVAAGLLMRLLLLLTVPTLSTDVYRYLWDGYVANQGVSPYHYPIDSPQLDYLDAPIRNLANHTWMASPYLPAAQWLFAAVAGIAPLQPLSMQIAMVGIDLINATLILYLLGLAGLPLRRLLIYFWNPLVVVEVAHGAHVDAWMICLTLAAVALAYSTAASSRSRLGLWLSPLVLASATLTKILPALLSPVFFWRWNWPQRLLFVTTASLLLLPAGLRAGWGLTGPLDGHGLFAAIRIYGAQWNFNSGLFFWLSAGLERYGQLSDALAAQWAKQAVAVVMLLILLWTWLQARKSTSTRSALRLMAVPLMGYTLLTPTLHPWYLLLLLAFLPYLPPSAGERRLLGWLWIAPWLYLSGALALSYLTYRNPLDLREVAWVRLVEWMPTLLLLALGGAVWAYTLRDDAETVGLDADRGD